MTIYNTTAIKLGWRDAVRAFFGRAVVLRTEIDVQDETPVLATRQTVGMAPSGAIKPFVSMSGYAMETSDSGTPQGLALPVQTEPLA